MQFSYAAIATVMVALSSATPTSPPPAPVCGNKQVASCCKGAGLLNLILGQSCSLLSVASSCNEQDTKCCSANNNGGIAVQLPCLDVL